MSPSFRLNRRFVFWLFAALVCLGAALALFVALSHPPELRVDLGAPGDGRFLGGFYQPEGDATSLRWTGSWSELRLHGLNGGPHLLRFRSNGDPIARADRSLRLERDGDVYAALTIAPAWRVYRVLLPARATDDGSLEVPPIRLASATHRPGPDDGRDLGVPIDWFQVSRVDLGATPLADGVVLRRVAMLVWGLALVFWILGFGFWIGRSSVENPKLNLQAPLSLLLVSLVAVALVLWAQRDPFTMAWALPNLPWTLGLLSVVLLAGRRAQGAGRRAHVAGRTSQGAGPQTAASGLPSLVSGLRSPVSGRLLVWSGLALLVVAQALFHAHWAVGVGIALALLGLFALNLANPQVESHQETALPPAPDAIQNPKSKIQNPIFLVLIFLLALGMRFYHLAEQPFGLWRDEARHGLIALDILENGYRPIYIAAGRVNMPALGLYPFALALELWGLHPWTMRCITALAGALTVLPLYALVARLWGRRDLALLAAAFLAVSSWHISISRFSFPTIFDPLLGLTGLWLLLIGLRPDDSSPLRFARHRLAPVVPRLLALAGSGVCIGLAVQTYHTGRVVPLVALALALLLLWRMRARWRQWFAGMLLVGVTAALVLAPLLRYALRYPDDFNDRVSDVFLLSENALYGRAPLAALDESLGLHLLMFNVRGDLNGRHYAPGRPMLDFVTGLGFLVGCAVLLRRRRDWRNIFLFAALGLSLLPSFLAVNAPHAMRSIGAAAFACIIAALGWLELFRLLALHPSSIVNRQSSIVNRPSSIVYPLSSVVLLALVLNAWTYFVVMAQDRAVWGEFYPVETKVGAFLRDLGERDGTAALAQVYVPAPLAEDVVVAYLTHGLPQAQTYGRNGLSRPPQPGALFVLPADTDDYTRDRAALTPYVGADTAPLLRGPLLPGTDTPSFEVYRGQE